MYVLNPTLSVSKVRWTTKTYVCVPTYVQAPFPHNIMGVVNVAAAGRFSCPDPTHAYARADPDVLLWRRSAHAFPHVHANSRPSSKPKP